MKLRWLQQAFSDKKTLQYWDKVDQEWHKVPTEVDKVEQRRMEDKWLHKKENNNG